MKSGTIGVYKPSLDELWFRQSLLADEKTMSYNHAWGGVIDFPKDRWADWYDRWVNDTTAERFYRYVTDERGTFIGEIAYHFDDELSGYVANVIILHRFRGMGYGKQALNALCFAAKENGVAVLYDDIAIDNPSVTLFLSLGFTESYRTPEKIILKKLL